MITKSIIKKTAYAVFFGSIMLVPLTVDEGDGTRYSILADDIVEEPHQSVAKDPVLEYQVLTTINKHANDIISYTVDNGDYWQTSNETHKRKMGDCEDYAIYKWEMLPDSVHSTIGVGWTENREMHAVLIVQNLVLDNRFDLPYPLGSKRFNLIYEVDLHNQRMLVRGKDLDLNHKLAIDMLDRRLKEASYVRN